jgi:hypothetical protein
MPTVASVAVTLVIKTQSHRGGAWRSGIAKRFVKRRLSHAHEWALVDRMLQSQLDESFVAHQYIIAAQAKSTVNVPSGFWGRSGERLSCA